MLLYILKIYKYILKGEHKYKVLIKHILFLTNNNNDMFYSVSWCSRLFLISLFSFPVTFLWTACGL